MKEKQRLIEDAFFYWVVNKCTTRFSTARDDYAKAAYLEATRQAYLDCVRICKETFNEPSWDSNCVHHYQSAADFFSKAIKARLKELMP